jgi:hypothetical protein
VEETSVIQLESFLLDMIGQERPLRIKQELTNILKRIKLHTELKALRNCTNNINDEKDLTETKRVLDGLLPAVKRLFKNEEDKQVIVISNLAAILLEEYSYLQIIANIVCSPRLRSMRMYIFVFLSAYRHLMAVKDAENALMFFLRSKNATDLLISTFEPSQTYPTQHISWLYESEFELLGKGMCAESVKTDLSGACIPAEAATVLMYSLNSRLVNELKVFW